MPTAPAASRPATPKPLPAPNSDFYEVYETLSANELVTVKRVRAFMETKVAPRSEEHTSELQSPC